MATYTVRVYIPTGDSDDPWQQEDVDVQAIGARHANIKARQIIRKRSGMTGLRSAVLAADYGGPKI